MDERGCVVTHYTNPVMQVEGKATASSLQASRSSSLTSVAMRKASARESSDTGRLVTSARNSVSQSSSCVPPGRPRLTDRTRSNPYTQCHTRRRISFSSGVRGSRRGDLFSWSDQLYYAAHDLVSAHMQAQILSDADSLTGQNPAPGEGVPPCVTHGEQGEALDT